VLIRCLEDCPEFKAGDHTRLRELLHPERQPAAIRYSLAHALLAPGESSTAHCLNSSEVYYILSGRGLMVIDDERCEAEPGAAIYIPPGTVQSIKNIGNEPLTFLCIVDPAWQPEDEIVLPDRDTNSPGPARETGKEHDAKS
jgi:mannose-6-phosphate isomerase-like protein (cupin superfamily)